VLCQLLEGLPVHYSKSFMRTFTPRKPKAVLLHVLVKQPWSSCGCFVSQFKELSFNKALIVLSVYLEVKLPYLAQCCSCTGNGSGY